MTDLIKIYTDMIATLEAQQDEATSDAVRAGIASLIEGAKINLEAAR